MLSFTRVATIAALLLCCACATRPYRSAPVAAPTTAVFDEAPSPITTVSDPVEAPDAKHEGRASVHVSIELPPSKHTLEAPRMRWATHGPEKGEEWQLEPGESSTTIANLPTGRVWIQVTLTDGKYEGYTSSTWLELKADHRTELAIDFDRGHVVTGRLVDKKGCPIAGREVIFTEPWSEAVDDFSASTTTDKCGRFRIVGLAKIKGTIVVEIPVPKEVQRRYHPQVVVMPQFQGVEDVMPGGEPVRIVEKDYDPAMGGFVIG